MNMTTENKHKELIDFFQSFDDLLHSEAGNYLMKYHPKLFLIWDKLMKDASKNIPQTIACNEYILLVNLLHKIMKDEGVL